MNPDGFGLRYNPLIVSPPADAVVVRQSVLDSDVYRLIADQRNARDAALAAAELTRLQAAELEGRARLAAHRDAVARLEFLLGRSSTAAEAAIRGQYSVDRGTQAVLAEIAAIERAAVVAGEDEIIRRSIAQRAADAAAAAAARARALAANQIEKEVGSVAAIAQTILRRGLGVTTVHQLLTGSALGQDDEQPGLSREAYLAALQDTSKLMDGTTLGQRAKAMDAASRAALTADSQQLAILSQAFLFGDGGKIRHILSSTGDPP